MVHVKRTANEAAHWMAKLGLDLNVEHLCREFVPLCIQQIVMAKKHYVE